MLYPTYRAPLSLIGLVVLLIPGTAAAEVSDKEPVVSLFWTVGVIAALLCLALSRLKPWLGFLVFTPATVWFISLFMELHSADVGPYLWLEQGSTYYLQAYAAFGLVLIGLVFGLLWYRRRRA